MNAVVIYESMTGNTRKAAGKIGAALAAEGVAATVCPITAIDMVALSGAELVIVGTWTDGLVLFGQRPGRSGRLRQLPVLYGKRAAVFATYAIDAGKVLRKLTAIVEGRGAQVVGGMTIRRDRLDEGVDDFVGRLLAVTSA